MIFQRGYMRNSFGTLFATALLILALPGLTIAQTMVQRTASSIKPVSKFDGNFGVFTPNWQEDIDVSSRANPDVKFKAPMFVGAGLDAVVTNLPYKEVMVRVQPNEKVVLRNSSVENEIVESSNLFRQSAREISKDYQGEWYPSSNVVVAEKVIQRGQHYQLLRVYPILVDRSGTTIKKAETVKYSVLRQQTSAPKAPLAFKTNSVANSVLDNGTWYKIGITSEGIYRLDFSYLQSLGIDVNSIDPRKIRIHGNGGGMLPQIVGQRLYDDLEENAITVVGENDGSFDANDYVLFYGSPQHRMDWFEPWDRFVHRRNLYSDTTYYFLTVGSTNGQRIASVASASNPTQTNTTSIAFDFYEHDEFNAIQSGRSWLGEHFDFTTNRTFSFPASNIVGSEDVEIWIRAAARSNAGSNYTIRESNNTLGTMTVKNVNTNIYGSHYYRVTNQRFSLSGSSITDGSIDVNMIYNKPDASSSGWLDYIEVQYTRNLVLNGSGTRFYLTKNIDSSEVHEFNLSGGSSGYTIWDVTDEVHPESRNYTLNGSTINFAVTGEKVRRFFAFTSSAFRSPASGKKITRQNVHGTPATEYLIIYHPLFKSKATELANFHRNNFPGEDDGKRAVETANIKEIFNEFSSGSQDPTAIRDFVKHMYEKSVADPNGPQLKWVLLFGDGAYDYKEYVSSNGNFIPSYQSRRSARPTDSYASDDYFGFVDDGEGFWGENAADDSGTIDDLYYIDGDTAVITHYLDISIGRFPVNTIEEATIMVDKVVNYYSNPTTFGEWRQSVLLVADHKDTDGTTHVSQADSYTQLIDKNAPCYNVDKIYLDNYDMLSTANGNRFPDATEALHNKLSKGSLIVNYTGHGGETGWSNAKILEIPDITKLDNGYKLPVYVTATCEFGRWDDPNRAAGAEEVILAQNGGAIAMFTTVRVVYSGPNYVLNTNFYRHVFEFDTILGRMPTMGEVFTVTKNNSWLSQINNRNFTLLGDPALALNYPKYKAVISTINGNSATDSIVDSIATMTKVTVSGEVQDEFGNKLTNYNGDMKISVFDKPSKFVTKRIPFTFFWQKNKIFNGAASVNNGDFTFEFVVPIDISYEDGFGKISVYFDNDQTDGGGCADQIYVGGTGSITDDKGPELELFMNDEKFADGGMVGSSPMLLAKLFDENGINTVGNGIGHELTAILNQNENEVIVLNDYYEAEKDSYQNGTIRYPFSELPVGQHSVRVKVWDVANNSAEGTVTFVVADDAEMALGHVLNYPNPFTTNTKFYVEHNRNGNLMDIQIKIFTVSGKLVKTLEDSFFSDGNLYCDLDWDGLDEYGDKLGRGVYVYQVTLKQVESGEKATKFEKLVVLR